jgi:hypothetical protein
MHKKYYTNMLLRKTEKNTKNSLCVQEWILLSFVFAYDMIITW